MYCAVEEEDFYSWDSLHMDAQETFGNSEIECWAYQFSVQPLAGRPKLISLSRSITATDCIQLFHTSVFFASIKEKSCINKCYKTLTMEIVFLWWKLTIYNKRFAILPVHLQTQCGKHNIEHGLHSSLTAFDFLKSETYLSMLISSSSLNMTACVFYLMLVGQYHYHDKRCICVFRRLTRYFTKIIFLRLPVLFNISWLQPIVWITNAWEFWANSVWGLGRSSCRFYCRLGLFLGLNS